MRYRFEENDKGETVLVDTHRPALGESSIVRVVSGDEAGEDALWILNRAYDLAICPIHNVPNQQCGGEHRYVETNLGDELLGPYQKPLGTPVVDMGKSERAAHALAKKQAKGQA